MENRSELAVHLASGDESAWRRFMSSYGRLALMAARKLGLSTPEQEEVFQETCLSVYRSISSLRDPESLPVWIYQIARRHGIRILRRRGRAASPKDELVFETLVDSSPTALDLTDLMDRAERVQRALQGLDPRCRGLISAIYLDPSCPSYAKIAREQGLPLGSIGPTRARCLGKLRKLLADVSAVGREGSILEGGLPSSESLRAYQRRPGKCDI